MWIPRPEGRPAPRTAPWIAGALLVGLAAAVVAYLRHVWVFTADDAYISLRYARMLAVDGSLRVPTVEGVSVEGYVNPLWVLLGALPELAGWSSILFCKALGILWAVCLLFAIFVSIPKRGHAWLAVVAAAGNSVLWIHAVSGMETTLYALQVTSLFLFFASDRVWASERPVWLRSLLLGVLGVGTALTRPEGILVFGGLLAAAPLVRPESRRLVLATAAVSLLLGGTYLAWRVWYWGRLLPQPYYAKVADGPVWASSVIRSGLECYGLIFAVALMVLALAVRRTKRGAGLRSLPHVPFLLAATPGVALVYLDVVPVMNYAGRYLFPAAMLFLSASVSAWSVAGRGAVRQRRGRVIPLALTLASIIQGVFAARIIDPQIQLMGRGLERVHVVLGRRLARVPRPGARNLCLLDCGAVPYLSGWRALDFGGLTSPAATATGGLDAKVLTECDLLLLESLDGRVPLARDPKSPTRRLYPAPRDLAVTLRHMDPLGIIAVRQGFSYVAFGRRTSEVAGPVRGAVAAASESAGQARLDSLR